MGLLSDYMIDNGLSKLDTEADQLHICAGEPTSYAEATTTGNKSVGSKNWGTGAVCGAPTAGTPNGRKVTTANIIDGSTSAAGTATYWAIVDSATSRLLAKGPLASSKVIPSSGRKFALPPIDIHMPAS